jgi:hypothetical protein
MVQLTLGKGRLWILPLFWLSLVLLYELQKTHMFGWCSDSLEPLSSLRERMFQLQLNVPLCLLRVPHPLCPSKHVRCQFHLLFLHTTLISITFTLSPRYLMVSPHWPLSSVILPYGSRLGLRLLINFPHKSHNDYPLRLTTYACISSPASTKTRNITFSNNTVMLKA